ncbi:2Fe-2S iron-sulfur cluster-binding protein [Phycicoccus sp. Soil748]|uniref:2Fe-2S iron-sulfur cluster-binding protein n=1 Tax=Phycicoccus sp. Soil748 TaxID=1736397 RepID=UPI0007031438|nr:2Fe-2S iron-sulfur cluster-binding protein [Phycicoccus sp. Soil748]KRE55423.1 ferredoxin [Phycicoccus sp. Soil748]
MPTVTIHPTGEVIYLQPGQTVLSGLYQAGFAYTVGCRRGGCAICKVDCRAGDFTYCRPVADTVISDAEQADGTCLTCRAVPEGDITIELRGEDVRLVNRFLHQINDKARQRAEAHAAANSAAGTPEKEQSWES